MQGWLEANIDYLLLALVIIAVFGVIGLWLHARKPPQQLPKFAWRALAAMLVVGWYFVESASDAERQHLRTALETSALTYGQELSRLGHAQVGASTDPEDPVYLALIDAEKRWRRVNPGVANIRTFRRADGRIRVIAAAENDYNHDGKYEGSREQRVPPGKEYPQVNAALVRALDGTPAVSEEPQRDAWGEWMSAYAPLRDAQGRVEAAVGVDLPAAQWMMAVATARQRMEWFLLVPLLMLGAGAVFCARQHAAAGAQTACEAKLRTALDGLPLDLWATDAKGGFLVLNDPAATKWGATTGSTLAELKITPAAHTAWEAINRRVLAGETVRGETTEETRGQRRHFHRVVAPVRVNEKIVGTVGAQLDITARVDADEARRKSEEKLALHVLHTPLAVIEWNLGFRVTAWNPAAERMFGFTATEAQGRHAVGFIVSENERAHVNRMWTALLAHKGGTRTTTDNLTKDGRTIHCEWYNTPLVDDTGAVIGVASSVQDVTARESLEKQLHQAQKMESIGQLAGGVAHEFNNLLTPMLVQTDIIAQQYAGDTKLRALLSPVQSAIQQATELNRRILAIGRRNAEQREPLALNQLVENSLALLRPSLDRRIEFTISLATGLEPLWLDRAHIAQIVMNLALNARDTLLEKLERGVAPGWIARLTVTTERVQDAVRRDGASAMPFTVPVQRLVVTDNGLGITPEVRARMFEPFFTTKPPGSGTGLGLAVVWNVVHRLGGWIEVENGPGGEGTRFQISLPVRLKAGTGTADPVAPVPVVPLPRFGVKSSRPLRILLAEDNTLVAETFSAVLGAAGHDVLVTQDGEEAWELFNQRSAKFDVVLADYNMPRISGGELLTRVKGAHFPGRVVIVSGYLTGEKVEELSRLGADAVLRKPFSPVELFAVLEAKPPA